MNIDRTGCIDQKRIARLAELNGQSIKNQCKQIGVSTGIMHRAMYTNELLTSESLCKLADYYGVTTDYLLGR